MLLKIQKELIFSALTKAITLLRNSSGWFVERESMQRQLATLPSLMNTNTTPQCRTGICSTFSTSQTNLADYEREETSIVPFLGWRLTQCNSWMCPNTRGVGSATACSGWTTISRSRLLIIRMAVWKWFAAANRTTWSPQVPSFAMLCKYSRHDG